MFEMLGISKRTAAALAAMVVLLPLLVFVDPSPSAAHEQTTQRCDYDPISGQNYNCRNVPVSHVHPPNHYSPPPDTSPPTTAAPPPTTAAPPPTTAAPPPTTAAPPPNHYSPPPDTSPRPTTPPPNHYSPPPDTSPRPTTPPPNHYSPPPDTSPRTTTTTTTTTTEPDDDDSDGDGDDGESDDGQDGECLSGTFVSGDCQPRGGDEEGDGETTETTETTATYCGNSGGQGAVAHHKHGSYGCHADTPGHGHPRPPSCPGGYRWSATRSLCELDGSVRITQDVGRVIMDIEGEVICTFAAGGVATRVVNTILRGVSEAAQAIARITFEQTVEHPCDQIWDELQEWAEDTYYYPETTDPADSESESGGGATPTTEGTPAPTPAPQQSPSTTAAPPITTTSTTPVTQPPTTTLPLPTTTTYCSEWRSFAEWGSPNLGEVVLYVNGESRVSYQGPPEWAMEMCQTDLAALDD